MKRPFEEIVAQHGSTVLRVCRAMLPRPDAEDAWSETFLAALRARRYRNSVVIPKQKEPIHDQL
jgi:DNA-directed RNA polymerase specialized sigma24 family protein